MAEDLALETELVTVVGDRALEIGNEQHGRDPGQCRHTLMLGRRRGLGNKPLPLDRRSRQAYPVASAWLTLESCLFVEARRLEGPLARVAILVAPKCGAARRRCACTARR
jgi:hypothetical protein